MKQSHVRLDLTTVSSAAVCAEAIGVAIDQGSVARRVSTRSHDCCRDTLASWKMGRDFETESGNEFMAILVAELCEEITAFQVQAVEIVYQDSDRVRRAYPDIALRYLNGDVGFWELKSERVDEALARRLGLLRARLQTRGIRYEVFTPLHLRQEPRLSNLRQLYRQADRYIDVPTRSALQAGFAAKPVTCLEALMSATGCDASQIYAAIAQGYIAAEVDAVGLCSATRVRLPKTGARSGAILSGIFA